jgi:hypothetical protein
MKRLLTFCAVIVATTMMLTGCFSGNDSRFHSLPEIKADYEETARSLTWPAAYPWPSADEWYRESEADMTFEAGSGKGNAGQEWECAWERELRDAVKTNSKTRQEAAIEMLEKLPTLDVWKDFDDATQADEIESLAKAKLGDFSEIAADAARCEETLPLS